MTIGAAVSTADIAKTVLFEDNAEISTDDTRFDYFRRKTGATTYPNDFANRGWSICPNLGSSNPTEGDRRIEGGQSTTIDNQIVTESGTDGWPEWKVENNQTRSHTSPSSAAINSWFYCLRPGVAHRLTATQVIDNIYGISGTNFPSANQINVFGYSSGYLSGSRVTYVNHSYATKPGSPISVSKDFTPDSGHPYVVINVESVGGGNEGTQKNINTAQHVYGMEIKAL